MYIISLSAIH